MYLRNGIPWNRTGGNAPACAARDERSVVRDPIEALLAETDRWFGAPRPTTPRALGLSPRLDVVDAGSEFRVLLEVPGVSEQDIELSIDGSTLVVKGEKRVEPRGENDRPIHGERTFGAFQRALELPCEVDASAVEAKLEHGLLVIRLPKSEKAKPRRIEVRKG
ncbi:MAG: Hsp20/alpha crystallin family protein [Planctomycetes bacterium]|nr:Hsp20/alpha crystallin family protein [Planctomycetota bacterium]